MKQKIACIHDNIRATRARNKLLIAFAEKNTVAPGGWLRACRCCRDLIEGWDRERGTRYTYSFRGAAHYREGLTRKEKWTCTYMCRPVVSVCFTERKMFLFITRRWCRKRESYIFRVYSRCISGTLDNENPYVQRMAIGYVPIKIQHRPTRCTMLKLPVKSAFLRPLLL